MVHVTCRNMKHDREHEAGKARNAARVCAVEHTAAILIDHGAGVDARGRAS